MEVLTDFADLAVLLPLTIVVAAALASSGWRRGALAWAVAVMGVLAAMLVLKVLVLAFGADISERLHNPSGHTAAGSVVYGGLIALLAGRSVMPPGLALLAGSGAAMLFGFTRVVLGWHTIFDVLIGGAVGAAGVLAMARLAGRRPPEVRPFVVLVVGAVVVLALHGHKLWAEATLYSIALRIRPG